MVRHMAVGREERLTPLLLPEPNPQSGRAGVFLQAYIADGEALYPDAPQRS